LYCSPDAHAKAYVGKSGALVGSANLTLRGFGGGLELLQYSHGHSSVDFVRRRLTKYCKRMDRVEIKMLEAFIKQNEKRITELRRNVRNEDRLPRLHSGQRRHFGDYDGFLNWLHSLKSVSAKEVYERANGKNQLSGHIHRNFYGLRQFFLAYPEMIDMFVKLDSDAYKLSADRIQEKRLKKFVKQYANDEEDFVLNIWKTYLPVECGGRAGGHGGTIGNLNRMFPLIARYLHREVGRRLNDNGE
jgi:hypothetical protein